MIEYFKGKLIELTPTDIVLEVAGVGYRLIISLRSYEQLNSQQEVLVYVEQYYLRDELPVTYGFATKDERDIFRLLTSVSGVGGNSARGILSTFDAAELQAIISTGDVAMLKRAKGLGQKTAEKVILELRDKICNVEVQGVDATAASVSSDVLNEALQALTMLGFKRELSLKALRKILSLEPQLSVEELIKRTLKSL